MKYFIFDMDETLAELYSVYYFIASLRLKESCKNEKIVCTNMSESLQKSLDGAYKLFVGEILKREVSTHPLGILRPGILGIMKTLRELQLEGKIKNVIIYSNNGHLESLEFIRDLIHKYIGSKDLIRECIHWNHHMRAEERTTQPGMANKTWNVLRNIMVNGNCKAVPSIQPEDVFFFDDLDHKDLQKNLGENYYKVPGYNFRASFDRIAEIYRAVIRASNVDVEEMVDYLVELFVITSDEYEKIVATDGLMDGLLDFFRGMTKGTASENEMVPKPDSGIEMMDAAISRVELKSGGVRKRIRIRVNTRKRKVMRYRVKSRSRKN